MSYNFKDKEAKIHVFVSSKEKSASISEGKKLKPVYTLSFKSKNVYSQEFQDKVHLEIFERYKANGYNDSILDEIKEKIDPSVYKSLEDYDKKTGYTNLRDAYVGTMLKRYRIKVGETPEEYELRVAETKKELLRIHDIEIDYDTKGLFGTKAVSQYSKSFDGKIKSTITRPTSLVRNLHFSRLGKKGDLDLSTTDKSKAKSELKEISDGLKEEPKGLFRFLNKKPSKEKIKVDGVEKGLFQKLKDFKDKHKKAFKRTLISGLTVITILSCATGIRSCTRTTDEPYQSQTTVESTLDNSEDNITTFDNEEPESYLDEQTETEDTEKNDNNKTTNESKTDDISSDSENNQKSDESSTELSDDSSAEDKSINKGDVSDSETKVIDESEENKTEEKNDFSTITLSNTEALKYLLCYSGIGFDSEFQITDGTYYETPEGDGKSGSYSNFEDSNVKITKIDVLKNGIYLKQYTAEDGNFQEIMEQYLNDSTITYSFHIETTDGKVLGWDNSENTLSSYLLSQYIESLNISSEIKEKILSSLSGSEGISKDVIDNLINELENENHPEIDLT